MVNDADLCFGTFDWQMVAQTLELANGFDNGVKSGRRFPVEGNQVESGRFKAEVLRPVLPEHDTGGAVGQRHPGEQRQFARVGLLLPRCSGR